MKKLKDFKTNELSVNSLFRVNGGNGTSSTTYTGSDGSSGSDMYEDCDGSGGLNTGDEVTLDTGRVLIL